VHVQVCVCLCVCVCTIELELVQADIMEVPYWFRDGTCSGGSSCNERFIPFPYLYISIFIFSSRQSRARKTVLRASVIVRAPVVRELCVSSFSCVRLRFWSPQVDMQSVAASFYARLDKRAFENTDYAVGSN
jgi:hypothetical protein